jgi:hypothetical protein
MKRFLLLVVGLGISGCTQHGPVNLLCAVVTDPSRYVGKRITLDGVAQMYQHSSTLRNEACPGQVLFLDMSKNDPSSAATGVLTPSGTFFAGLAMRRASSVTVTGSVVRTLGEPNPYVLVVESGGFK